MSIDFGAALARMHAAADEVFAKDATFVPLSGPSVPCRVEKFLPELQFGLEHAQTVAGDTLLKVVKTLLPGVTPKKGDAFQVGPETFRVISAPTTEDDDGLRWTIPVELA